MLYLYMFLLRMPQTFADGKQSVGGIKGNRADPAQVGGELAGGMQLGGGDFGGRVFLLHEDKIRRILFFLAKVTAENLFVKLSAKTKAPPSNHVASAAAEGAVLFIYCSRRSTSRTFPPSTAVAVALPSTRSPERNLSRASFLNSLTALIIALSLLPLFPPNAYCGSSSSQWNVELPAYSTSWLLFVSCL